MEPPLVTGHQAAEARMELWVVQVVEAGIWGRIQALVGLAVSYKVNQ